MSPTRCVAPKLKGLKRKAARLAIAMSGCKVGKVTKRKTPRRGVYLVKRQSVAPGAIVPLMSPIDLVLERKPLKK